MVDLVHIAGCNKFMFVNDDFLLQSGLAKELYKEIKDLPRASQKVMLLALNGLKNPEIAAELGISINTVKTQKKIAYAKLKNSISPLLHSIVLSL